MNEAEKLIEEASKEVVVSEILIDKKSQENIMSLCMEKERAIKQITSATHEKINIIIATIVNVKGLTGNYTLSEDLTKLKRVP